MVPRPRDVAADRRPAARRLRRSSSDIAVPHRPVPDALAARADLSSSGRRQTGPAPSVKTSRRRASITGSAAVRSRRERIERRDACDRHSSENARAPRRHEPHSQARVAARPAADGDRVDVARRRGRAGERARRRRRRSRAARIPAPRAPRRRGRARRSPRPSLYQRRVRAPERPRSRASRPRLSRLTSLRSPPR